MKKLGFGIIGCGVIGKIHSDVISKLDNAELVAVYSIPVDAAEEFAAGYEGCKCYHTLEEMLADPAIDVVSICTPSGLHYDATIAAAKAKKHVICEKPIDINLEKAKRMVAACEENGVTFSVILQHRFDDPVMALKKAANEGHFGKLLWGASRTIWHRTDEYFDNGWRGTWAADGGGALINQSIHYIDLLLNFFGPVKSVSGKCRRTVHHQIETEDLGVATVEFANGAIGTIEGSTACYPGLYTELSIFGEKGSAIIRNDNLIYCKLQGEVPEYLAEKITTPDARKEPLGKAHAKQYSDTIEAILNNKTPSVSGYDSTASLELIKAIYTSSDEKREVFIQKH
ncbi:MAG: Gfo/Idh/MocA family oxidoreductase [Clostridia bacterium]